MTVETMEQVPLGDLTPYSDNPRQGDVGAICVSLEANGQYRPIVVNRPTMTILAGNHTFHAAKSLGWGTIAATFVDVDDATARRIVLVDNRTNDLASYDDQVLAEMLTAIAEAEGPEGLVGTGFDGDDLDELLGDLKNPTDNDWRDAFGATESDEPDHQQMTFVLHVDQIETVKAAIEAANALGNYDSPNQNRNGNAIARVCETFLTRQQ